MTGLATDTHMLEEPLPHESVFVRKNSGSWCYWPVYGDGHERKGGRENEEDQLMSQGASNLTVTNGIGTWI